VKKGTEGLGGQSAKTDESSFKRHILKSERKKTGIHPSAQKEKKQRAQKQKRAQTNLEMEKEV